MRRKTDNTGQISLFDYLNMLDEKDDQDTNEKEDNSGGFSSLVTADSGASDKTHAGKTNHGTGDFKGHVIDECNASCTQVTNETSTDRIIRADADVDAVTENEIYEIVSYTFERSDELREEVHSLKVLLLMQRVFGLKKLYRLYPSFTMQDGRRVSFSSLGIGVGTKEEYREYNWMQIERSVFRKERR